LVIGLNLEVNEYGAHEVRAALTVGDRELMRTRNLYVVNPSESEVR